MFDKIDVRDKVSFETTTAGGKLYYLNNLDVTITMYGDSQRIYFERISDIDNLPCRFAKVQHFDSPYFQNGKIQELI